MTLTSLLGPSQPLWGQQTPTFSSNVNVVNVLATVRDKHGQIVNNLTKDDFKLEEDGHPQTIRYFAKDTDLPLTLGLLVDTSMSQRRVLEQERVASYAFLEHLMREDKDKAFVIHFDWDVELLQDLTSSRQKLNAALEKLDNPEFQQSGGGGGSSGSGGHHRGGGTTLYDAVFLASDELMQKQQGRKALIILSDGVDTGSKVTLTRAIEAAQRANTLVYSILFSDKEAYGNGGYGGHMGGMGGGMGRHGGMGRGGPMGYPQESHPDGKKVLEQISKETGGRFFEVSKKQSIDQIYASIEEELRNQYSLGYTPDKADATPGYHKINLTTTQKDLVVQTRDGYYSAGSAAQP
ncbi:MAG: VWA domain-containing protein [Candidatus Korobacteraceae bacterium]